MSNAPISDLHKAIVNGIWRSLTTMEILAELTDPRGLSLTLGDAEERAMEDLINDLRRRVQEAKDCGAEAALKAAQAGLEWKEVIEYLEKPYLLPSPLVIAYAVRAFEKDEQ